MDRGENGGGAPVPVHAFWERLGTMETRLGHLQGAASALAVEIERVARIIRGNGEDGLFGRIRLLEEGLEIARRQMKWLFWFQGTLIAALVGAIVASCGFSHDPSGRTAREFTRPDGTRVHCHEPPPDVVPAAVGAEVEARISKLVEVLNARLGVEEAFARIRAECPTLQAVEALEFRMCAAWAQGVLDDEAYGEFLTEILPLLRDTCGNADEPSGDLGPGAGRKDARRRR
jgi:hypothetical protein